MTVILLASVKPSAQLVFWASCVVPPQLVNTMSSALAAPAKPSAAEKSAIAILFFMFPCPCFGRRYLGRRRPAERREGRRRHDLVVRSHDEIAYLRQKSLPVRIGAESG